MFNTTFKLYRGGVLLVGKTGGNHRPAASHWQTLSYDVALSALRLSGIGTHNLNGDIHWLHR